MNSYIQRIPLFDTSVSLNILRLDEIHPFIQGNKYYKLFYNIEYAIKQNLSIVTFGGPYSNHIQATALACKKANITCFGIIRGNNFKYKSSTIIQAEECGMKIIYVDRDTFKDLRTLDNLAIQSYLTDIQNIESKIHVVPEGGTNQFGIQGAEKIIEEIDVEFDLICCPVGTGGTISGIINSLKGNKELLGFSSLKDEYLTKEVEKFTNNLFTNWKINYDYHFGGYAKWNQDLINYINEFKVKYNIPLCPIYTGKMMYGINHLVAQNYFKPNTRILAIHTGGLQGIEGFNKSNKNILV